MANLQTDGWTFDDLKYVELSPEELDLFRLNRGDILFNRTNSKELVGKCEVFDEPGEWVFASYMMRLTIDPLLARPAFVSAYLSGPTGRAQIERDSRQIIGMTNINAEEIRGLEIPLPLRLEEQDELLADLNEARNARDAGLSAADELLVSIDGFLLDELGLALPPRRDPAMRFAVRFADIKDGRLDPQSHAPYGVPRNTRGLPFVEIGSLLAPPHSIDTSGFEDNDMVPYLGLPECDLHEIREIAERRFADVRGRAVAREGDILFARIEPSVFNRKYVFADRIGDTGWAYLSTEFYPVHVEGSESDQRYLYAILLSELTQRQVRGKTTGTSGRRRLNRDMFDSLLVPWPSESERATIAAEVDRRRAEARRLRNEARAIWDDARSSFEEALLGPAA